MHKIADSIVMMDDVNVSLVSNNEKELNLGKMRPAK